MNEIDAFVIKAMDSEATLAERHEAFSVIVRAFQDMAYACAYAVLKDFHLAEDAAQEAFIPAWQKLHQLREPKAFPGWFRRIVRSECNRLTSGKRSSIVSLNGDAAAIFENLQTMIEANELQKAAFAAVKKLPEHERVVVALFLSQRRFAGRYQPIPGNTDNDCRQASLLGACEVERRDDDKVQRRIHSAPPVALPLVCR